MSATHHSIDMYPVHRVPITRPFIWLSEAWNDMFHHPAASLAYGWIVATFGALIIAYSRHPFYLALVIAAFLLVGPIITAGLCELSRRRDHGEEATFQASIEGLKHNRRALLQFATTLAAIAVVGFVLCASVLYSATGSIAPNFQSTIWGNVMTHLSSTQLLIYGLTFAVLSLIVFALSVVTVPMIIDRHVDANSAMRMSLRAALKDLPAMLMWAILVLGLVLVGYATWLLGMIIVLPLLGHATWYAYRDIVEEA